MNRQQQRQFRNLLLLCMLVSPSGLLARSAAGVPLTPEAAEAAAMGAKPASARLGETIRGAFTPDTYQQGKYMWFEAVAWVQMKVLSLWWQVKLTYLHPE
jgi:hypothetical protein